MSENVKLIVLLVFSAIAFIIGVLNIIVAHKSSKKDES